MRVGSKPITGNEYDRIVGEGNGTGPNGDHLYGVTDSKHVIIVSPRMFGHRLF